MKYRWAECPGCRAELAINFTETAGRITGSLRRWSSDRSVNDGRSFTVLPAEVLPDGGFMVACVCGQPISVPAKADAVSAEREGDLRVKLGE